MASSHILRAYNGRYQLLHVNQRRTVITLLQRGMKGDAYSLNPVMKLFSFTLSTGLNLSYEYLTG